MTQRIVIEGALARIEETTTVAEAPLADLAPHLITRLPTIFPVLPRNTRYVMFDPESKRGVLMVEMAPKVTTLSLHLNRGDYRGVYTLDRSSRANFKVALPYQYFAYPFSLQLRTRGGIDELIDFTIDSSSLYWRPSPIRGEDDRLWFARIPNVDTGAGICWGHTNAERSSLSARIDDMTGQFDTTVFNDDLGLRSADYPDFNAWRDASVGVEGAVAFMNWDMFKTDESSILVRQLPEHTVPDVPTRIARIEGEASFVAMPALPTNFTLGRATEWLESLTPAARTRMIAAATALPVAEEVPA